jgi:hypothetical protein
MEIKPKIEEDENLQFFNKKGVGSQQKKRHSHLAPALDDPHHLWE